MLDIEGGVVDPERQHEKCETQVEDRADSPQGEGRLHAEWQQGERKKDQADGKSGGKNSSFDCSPTPPS